MKTKYNVKLLNGSKQEVTYSGIETITLPDADSEGVKKFTAGEPLDSVPITLDFSEGDQTVDAPEGYVVRSAVVKKPDTLLPENITEGVEIAGVVGTAADVGKVICGTASEIKTSQATFLRSGFFSANSYIERALFSNCSYIGSYAFYSCPNLVQASFPDCEAVHSSAFYNCVALSDFYAPKVKRISERAFAFMILESIEFPDCTSIGTCAFLDNYKLSIVSLSRCTSLGSSAFRDCSSLQTAYIPQVNAIESGAFDSCINLSSLITGQIKHIGSYAFLNCAGIGSLDTSMCSYIGDSAFYGANSADIETSRLLGVGSKAFSTSNVFYSSLSGFGFYKDILITAAAGASNMPSNIRIIASRVYGTTALNMQGAIVKLPSSLEVISPYAFYGQTALRASGVLPNLKRIGSYAFSGCGHTTSFDLSAVNCTYIGDCAFYRAGYSSAYSHNLYFPKASYIGSSCFYSMSSKSCYLTLSSEVFVGDSAFYYCTTLYLKNSILTLGNVGSACFYYCTKISTVMSFSSTRYVAQSAFLNCISLPAVIFNNNSTCSIYSWAFCTCKKLASVYLLGEPVDLASINAFASTPLSQSGFLGTFGSIYVPASLYSVYLSKTNWSQYSSRFVSMTDEEITAFLDSWKEENE